MPEYGRIRIGEQVKLNESYALGVESAGQFELWKLKVGDAVTVSDAECKLFRARVLELGGSSPRVYVFEENGVILRGPEITLLQALPEKERMELIIQKTSELGASVIIPFKSTRSISLEERDSRQKKAHKWQDVALKASKQSRSEFITRVYPYASFAEALETTKDASLKIALWERPGIKLLKDVLADAKKERIGKAAILIGPEGGLEEEEINKTIDAGFVPVSLGRRILRTETASIMAVGLIRYELSGL